MLREAGLTCTHVNGRTRELEERFPGLLEFLSAAVARELPATAAPGDGSRRGGQG
ncbi:hypothetical protein [Pseudonocardia adelaidensis]|uniref:hypothetical protein n=1 Tax=Pseudonocardia adelaidensis TaxID=648754 RepID=UPI0031E669C3